MTLLELPQFRSDAKDTVATYLFGDLEVIGWLGEAEEEACIRARLLFDDATAAPVRDRGDGRHTGIRHRPAHHRDRDRLADRCLQHGV